MRFIIWIIKIIFILSKMNSLVKFINKGFLVGCGGGGGSSIVTPPVSIPIVGFIITLNNPRGHYESGIYYQNNELNIKLEYDRILTIESGVPFISINNSINLNYVSGTGTKYLNFKTTIPNEEINYFNIEIDFFVNNSIIKDESGEVVDIAFLDKPLEHLMIFNKYLIGDEFNNNLGLTFHKANYAYSNNIYGKDIKIGIVDSGLDRNHIDFNAKINDGFDYGGENYEIKNIGNHGSHVGGIVSANYNNNGMHGFSFLSKLVDFRVFNNQGYWRASDSQMGEMTNIAKQQNINIINNSWGYVGHFIDGKKYYNGSWVDYNINTFLSSQEVSGYLSDHNIVNIFAAGNDSYTNPGILPGLPLIYNQVSQLWICVISTDKDGNEAYYSNRAGLANLWSISGHGGDYYTDGGVLSVQSNGTYVRMQGTSMACPSISGGLGLIMNKFLNNNNYPEMTAQLCVDRLFQTADYTGLKAGISDSDDILKKDYDRGQFNEYKDVSELTINQKKEIFGYGKMNLESALQEMTETQFQELKDFSEDRKTQINQISVSIKNMSKKFMNSIDKDRVLL